ncbi:hypothetical protein RHMOL_Rhmol07G0225000 [Rhododendron molle]|uniref:Uncharacterized protein n=1 Tax=Rhododendron molle TaxID=49168 RepID=A0ACC0N3X3_RHOML|nr:hypothetical protein RHMOL_Rhmol07G0225000 [Rhododendron molle]
MEPSGFHLLVPLISGLWLHFWEGGLKHCWDYKSTSNSVLGGFAKRRFTPVVGKSGGFETLLSLQIHPHPLTVFYEEERDLTVEKLS